MTHLNENEVFDLSIYTPKFEHVISRKYFYYSGYVWFYVKCFPSVKYFQVKIFSGNENIFKYLVAFQKML